MKTVYAKIYSQHRGRIKFPIDMLRYDSCYPAKETDSHFLQKLTDEQQVFNNKKHWVVVVAKKVPEKAKAPHFTNKRWESFKCFVVALSLINLDHFVVERAIFRAKRGTEISQLRQSLSPCSGFLKHQLVKCFYICHGSRPLTLIKCYRTV